MLRVFRSKAPRDVLMAMLLIVAYLACGPDLTKSQEQVADAPKAAELPILIVDSKGEPIPGVKVIPWALGCGQGHGTWGPFEGKPDESGMEPMTVVTDDKGLATVIYPYFRSALEQTRTLVVSVQFDRPNYAYNDAEHIDVPLISDAPHKITMTAAATIEITPSIDGRPAALDDLYAIWSNHRSWKPDGAPEKLAAGKLRICGFLPGSNSVLVVRIANDTITHFCNHDFDLEEGSVSELALALKPAVRVVGKLSEDVPRPVRDGRVVALTIPSNRKNNLTMWVDWTPVAEDGSFVFEAWPDGERIQLIALCDGYIATSGKAPDKELEFPNDGYHRPHSYEIGKSEIVIPMMPLVPVTVTVTKDDNAPVAGLDVATSPNVGWWNFGSQIYGLDMVQGKKLVQQREYLKIVENPFPNMFRGLTDSRGQVTFQLPAAKQYIEVLSDEYELPIELGRRARRPVVEQGKPLKLSIRVQPAGTEMLGDWDKLAGVVYGCSTVEGRKYLALPGMKEKAEEFIQRFSEAKNQQDPAMLAEAYLILASAFLSAGEKEEALKWRQKANELRSK